MNLEALVDAGIRGESIGRADALELLNAPDSQVLPLVAAAGQVRRHFFGNQVWLNYLVNLKSGLCPEDCSYCSQAHGSSAEILRYTWLSPDQIDTHVRAGVERGASTVCLVASGRGPSSNEVDRVASIIEGIHRQYPLVKICACLGFLDESKAHQLAEAGASRYNHNLNTAKSSYDQICSTHTYTDRVATVRAAQTGGLSACTGLIAGMGESDEQLVEVAFGLRDLGADSVPVNFLLPFEGTPLATHQSLTPQRCLKILAMVRFVHPDVEVRSAAGREYHLRTQQPLVLEICNSIFLGDYLTSEGQAGQADLAMIADAGFEVAERSMEDAGQICTGDNQAMATVIADHDGLRIRHRGAGTQYPANV